MMAAVEAVGSGSGGRRVVNGDFPGREPAPATMLVADDLAPQTHQLIRQICAANLASLVVCRDGADALLQIGRLGPDIVMISSTLPVVAAPDLITAVRRHLAIPIAVSVEAGDNCQASQALAAGATTTLSKPYQAHELWALLTSWLVRARARWDHESVLSVGPLEGDSRAYEVRVAGKPLKFTLREFELLRLLALHTDQVFTREHIRQDVWRALGEVASTNTIAVHIRRSRARLAGTVDLVSVRGVGYRLTAARPGSN